MINFDFENSISIQHENLTLYSWIKNKNNLISVPYFELSNSENVNNFIKEIMIYFHCTENNYNDFKINIVYGSKFLITDDIFININNVGNKYSVTAITTSMEYSQKIWDIQYKISNSKDKIFVDIIKFIQSNDGSIQKNITHLNYSDIMNIKDYYFPYIDVNELYKEFYQSENNILMFSGKSGVGKSKLATLGIKYIFEYPENVDNKYYPYYNVIIVSNPNILLTDSFWNDINQINVQLIILDDLQTLMNKNSTPSQQANSQLFNNLFLSFTDGIIKNRYKFIITTNLVYQDITPQILRSGRTFDFLEIRELTNTEALEIWKKEGLSKEIFSLKEPTINTSILSQMIEKQKKALATEKKEYKYLTDISISKIKDIQKKHSFGF